MSYFKRQRGLSAEALMRIKKVSANKEAEAPDYDPTMETQLFGDYNPLFTEKAIPSPDISLDLNMKDRLTQLFMEMYDQMPNDPQGALEIAMDLYRSENEM